MLDYKDYTLKAKLTDVATVEEMLANLNADFIGVDEQTDFYFETTKGKLKYRKGTIEHLITHYAREVVDGVEKTTVYRYDKNPSPEEVDKLTAEHRQIGITMKQRKIFNVGNVKVHLDTLPDGQHFLEIEAIDRSNKLSDDELKQQCLSMLSKLKIPTENLIPTGYLKED